MYIYFSLLFFFFFFFFNFFFFFFFFKGLVVQGINYQDIIPETSRYHLYKQNSERNNRQGRLLLVSLLENFCAMYDQSPQINQQLFYVICKQLSKMGVIII